MKKKCQSKKDLKLLKNKEKYYIILTRCEESEE